MIEIPRRGVCLVLSAPSGAGKTAIADALLATEPRLERSISVTTRERRPREIDGVHYHFRTEEQFQDDLRNDALLEWARVLQGTRAYGTPRAPVEKALSQGRDVVFDIDWQGHRQLRAKLPADVVSVFVLPPNLAALRSRLVGRAGDTGPEIERRMRVATEEIRHWVDFDHVVVNEVLTAATEQVRAVLHAARSATARQIGLSVFAEQLESE
jgi:guanylate kinase